MQISVINHAQNNPSFGFRKFSTMKFKFGDYAGYKKFCEDAIIRYTHMPMGLGVSVSSKSGEFIGGRMTYFADKNGFVHMPTRKEIYESYVRSQMKKTPAGFMDITKQIV